MCKTLYKKLECNNISYLLDNNQHCRCGIGLLKISIKVLNLLREIDSAQFLLEKIPADYLPVGFTAYKSLRVSLETGQMESRVSMPNFMRNV